VSVLGQVNTTQSRSYQ